MPRLSSTIAKLRRAALLAAFTAPLGCGASAGEDDTSSTALPVQAAAVPTPCTTTTVVNGNVVIATPQDAVAYRCVSVIHGDLSVLSAPGTLYGDVDLSSLETVHGDVLLAYAPRIDVPSTLRAIRLGKLTAIVRDPVGGTAELRAHRSSFAATGSIAAPPPPPPRAPYVHSGRLVVSIEFGELIDHPAAFDLGALSRVDSDVSVELKGTSVIDGLRTPGGAITSGLDSLATIHGDLHLAVSTSVPDPGNACLAPFLHALRTVEGTVRWNPTAPNEFGGIHLGLQTIGGDLILEPVGNDNFFLNFLNLSGPFDGVRTVGGAVRFRNKHLRAQTSATTGAFEVVDSPVTFVGGGPTTNRVLIQNNPKLYDFQLDGRVVGNGPIVIVKNPALAQCLVDAFIAKQRSLGWTGTATTSGNLNGPSPYWPCP